MNWEGLTLFLYIVARVSGFIMFNPLLNRNNIPSLFKAGIILVLSIFTMSITQQVVEAPAGVFVFMIRILMEFMLGLTLGMIVNFFLAIPQIAGLMIDTQMGMTMNQIYDAGSQSNMSVTSIFLNVMMILMFFVAGGHHTLFRILITSGEIVPYGAVRFNMAVVAGAVLELFVECMIMAIKLSLPILAAELLGQLGMGILMKAIPQINVFSINVELKILIGLVMLFFMISPFSEFLVEAEHTMLNSLEMVLKLTVR